MQAEMSESEAVWTSINAMMQCAQEDRDVLKNCRLKIKMINKQDSRKINA
jgi:hypothetical protein